MRKLLGVALFLLLGLAGLAEPVAAEPVEGLKREAGADGLYREVIDISGYDEGDTDHPLQFKIENGTFKDFNVIANSSYGSAYETFISSNNVYLPGMIDYKNKLEIVIESETGDYSIEINTASAPDDAFDFTDMPIKDGNIVEFNMTTSEDTDKFFDIYLEAGREYYYVVNTGHAFDILSPDGSVLKSYREYGSSLLGLRRNNEISSTLSVNESGIYRLRAEKSPNHVSFGVSIYEIIDDVKDVGVLTFNGVVPGQSLKNKGYVLRSDISSAYSITPENLTGNYGYGMSFRISGVFQSNVGSTDYEDAFELESLASGTVTKGRTTQTFVYNQNPDTYLHLHEWWHSYAYEQVDVKAQPFTVKTGVWSYNDWEGNTVRYKNGFPDFKGSGFVRQEVKLDEFTTRSKDFRNADKISPKSSDGTWHHHEDGQTLQEVETRIHSRFTHRGGFSMKN